MLASILLDLSPLLLIIVVASDLLKHISQYFTDLLNLAFVLLILAIVHFLLAILCVQLL